jgi:3-hydroxy-3-methylglutaryl CoA synthase
VDGLDFASTTSPYKEKQAASLVALAADLRRELAVADFADSLRAGTTAMRAALDAVQAGSAKRFLVAAADCRLGTPQGDFEQVFGDGAAALMFGDTDVAVAIEGSYTHTDEFVDIWRREGDSYVRSWEDRFIITHGYTQNMEEAVKGILKKYSLGPKDFARVVLYGPDPRNHLALARGLGFDPKAQVQDPLFDTVGNTGAAFALMQLVAALEQAQPGDRILLANYGDGADAYILRVTDQIEKVRNRRAIKGYLKSKMPLASYEKYVSFRQLMSREAARRPGSGAAVPASWRDRQAVISLYGHKCLRCGTVQFPMERVCHVCQAKDQFDKVRLSDQKGEVFTYTIDNLEASIDPPTAMAVLDLANGCRLFLQMTDRDPNEVKIGLPVELTFRRLLEAGGIYNYYWKCRPLREGGK